MKNIYLSLLLFSFLACDKSVNNENEFKTIEASLIDYQFRYDVTAFSNFSVKEFASFQNDTLKIYDYWALIDQPNYIAQVLNNKDTLQISYIPNSIFVRDWLPTVETYLRIYLRTNYDHVILHFSPVSRARKINISGFRNANEDFFYCLSF